MLLICLGVRSQAEDASSFSIGAFTDFYVVTSTAVKGLHERQYTTQALRTNEINLNLAYAEGVLAATRLHGRVALQAGTSVQANYSSEPNIFARNLQEFYLGFLLADQTWMDGGVMLSHIGIESFISKDSLVYTRSLVAEFSPYYQSGVRITHEFNEKASFQLLLLNGWQNISQSSPGMAAGTQFVYVPNRGITLLYNTYFGQEGKFRQLHDFVLKLSPSDRLTLASQLDFGMQAYNATGIRSSWSGFTQIGNYKLDSSSAVSARAEAFFDEGNVVAITPNLTPFQAWSASLGYDRALSTHVDWRSEAKATWASPNIFGAGSTLSKELVWITSLALKL